MRKVTIILKQTPQILLYLLLFLLIAISFAITVTSTYFTFMISSFTALVVANIIVNIPYLKGTEDCQNLSFKETIDSKIILSVVIWSVGICISLIVMSLLPYMQNGDPSIEFVFYGYVHLIGIIFLTAFPFLAINNILIYLTYRTDKRKIINFDVILTLSVFFVLIFAVNSYYTPIIADEYLAFAIGSLAAIISIFVAFVYRRMILDRCSSFFDRG